MRDIQHWLRQAYKAAELSPDLSTQNGAVLLGQDEEILSIACNSIPPGVRVTPERLGRPLKYPFTIHAEESVICKAARAGKMTFGGTLIVPWYACDRCAPSIIQSGIARIIGHRQCMERPHPSWKQSIEYGETMLREAGIKLELYDGEIGGCKVRFNYEEWTP